MRRLLLAAALVMTTTRAHAHSEEGYSNVHSACAPDGRCLIAFAHQGTSWNFEHRGNGALIAVDDGVNVLDGPWDLVIGVAFDGAAHEFLVLGTVGAYVVLWRGAPDRYQETILMPGAVNIVNGPMVRGGLAVNGDTVLAVWVDVMATGFESGGPLMAVRVGPGGPASPLSLVSRTSRGLVYPGGEDFIVLVPGIDRLDGILVTRQGVVTPLAAPLRSLSDGSLGKVVVATGPAGGALAWEERHQDGPVLDVARIAADGRSLGEIIRIATGQPNKLRGSTVTGLDVGTTALALAYVDEQYEPMVTRIALDGTRTTASLDLAFGFYGSDYDAALATSDGRHVFSIVNEDRFGDRGVTTRVFDDALTMGLLVETSPGGCTVAGRRRGSVPWAPGVLGAGGLLLGLRRGRRARPR